MAKLNSTNVFGDLTVANDIDAAGEILEDGLPVATENYVSNNFLNSSDYNPEADTHSRYTDGEASSAAPVQSVNGQVGDVSIASLASSVEVISSSTTWNKPSGAEWIIFYAIGAGGSSASSNSRGGGGGGGVVKQFPADTLPGSIDIQVGAGGFGDGGDTIVGNTLLRAGGGGQAKDDSSVTNGGYINGFSPYLRTPASGGNGGATATDVSQGQNSLFGAGGGAKAGFGDSLGPNGGGTGQFGFGDGPPGGQDGADASAFLEAGEGGGGGSTPGFGYPPAGDGGFPGGGGGGRAVSRERRHGAGADGAVKIAVLRA